jgi:hypothetical protein
VDGFFEPLTGVRVNRTKRAAFDRGQKTLRLFLEIVSICAAKRLRKFGIGN